MATDSKAFVRSLDVEHVTTHDTAPSSASPPTERKKRSTQILDRYLTFLPIVAFSATLQASWESVGASLLAVFYNGGPTALVYGMILATIGTTAAAASLAEMAAINPTVGAQYRWTALYAPRGLGKMSPAFFSLMQGWITVFAYLATAAIAPFLLGTTLQGLIILNYPTYAPQRWHGTLFTWAFLIVPVIFNIYGRRFLARLEIFGGTLHIVVLIVIIAVMSATGPKSSDEFVWKTTVTGLSGWSDTGVQWCIGLLTAAFPLGGFDGVLHMSDEVRNASVVVPQSMIWSVLTNGAMALAYIICILYTMGDYTAALTSPSGYPVLEIYYQATGSLVAMNTMVALTMLTGVVALLNIIASISRLVWAFARDGGLPFSKFWGKVHPTLRVPLNAMMLITAVVILLSLINLGSTTAFYAILSLGTLALYISYIPPVLFITIRKISGRRRLQAFKLSNTETLTTAQTTEYNRILIDAYPARGPFHISSRFNFDILVNIFSICYCTFIATFLPFPSTVPVTGENMNYSGPVMLAVLTFAVADWCLWGRKRFRVPVEVDVKGKEVEDRGGSEE